MPVIVGGNGPRRTPELAARFATEFNLGFPALGDIPERIARVHAACERIGRDPASLSLSLAMSTFAGPDDVWRFGTAPRGWKMATEVRDGVNIVGGPAEIAERMTSYAELGIDRVYLQLLDLQDVDHVEYLGTGVFPSCPADRSGRVKRREARSLEQCGTRHPLALLRPPRREYGRRRSRTTLNTDPAAPALSSLDAPKTSRDSEW